jgi:hypothetical protein
MSTVKELSLNEANYKDFKYCIDALSELGKQMYDGKDLEKTALELVELRRGIEHEGDFKTLYYLVPSIKAMLGQCRFL